MSVCRVCRYASALRAGTRTRVLAGSRPALSIAPLVHRPSCIHAHPDASAQHRIFDSARRGVSTAIASANQALLSWAVRQSSPASRGPLLWATPPTRSAGLRPVCSRLDRCKHRNIEDASAGWLMNVQHALEPQHGLPHGSEHHLGCLQRVQFLASFCGYF